jgi:hypothetical protein
MVSDGTRLAGLGVFARDAVGLQRGVEGECELKHCIDEEGGGLRLRVTGRRKMSVKGAATLPDRSFLLYPVLPRLGAGGPAADFGRIHFGTG